MDDFLDHLDRDPFAQFDRWFADAHAAGLWEPEAMALATSTPDGRPSVRIVLLRARDERGFVFFTNRESRKGRHLAENPRAAFSVVWKELDRQISVTGSVTSIDEAESDAYFATRPRGSQLGAWASAQSRPLDSRFALLRRVAQAQARFLGGEIARPPHWGGYLLRPERIEFWVSKASRLHERTLYARAGERWETTRLQP